MNERTNYGKIIAVTIAVITAASAIACVIYHLCRKFFLLEEYTDDELAELELDELEEEDDLFFEDEQGQPADEAEAEA